MTAARLHWILTAIERNLLTEEELALLKALENPEDLTQNQPIKSCGDGRLEWLFRDCLMRYFKKRGPKFAPTPRRPEIGWMEESECLI